MTRYRTIVADPPWHYGTWPVTRIPKGVEHDGRKVAMPYSTMTVGDIASLPVRDLADPAGCHLYLWTTNRYLRDAYDVAKAWGFAVSMPLIWVKTPMPCMIGGTYAPSAEFFLFCRRGTLTAASRPPSQWFHWPRQRAHSVKPDAMLDLVESVSPGPYLEMFARRNRLGWDTWGNESLEHVDLEGGAA